MLKVDNISFGYDKKTVLLNVSFTAKKGEHVALIGESGSGKSTILKLLQGEYDLRSGEILWNDKKILGPSYNLVIGYSFIKYVAQEFELMPYTTVAENIGSYLSNFFLEEKQKRINELLGVVELTEFSNTKVQFLSGGQKQRVALAKAIALEPELILLDEPFTHIDNFKKQSLRRSLFQYLKKQKITCVIATHDKNDVLPFSDKVVVLNQQEILAIDSPKNLYQNPKSRLIASFFGEFNYFTDYGLVYAHQILVVESSSLKAEVVQSFFQGRYYLIEAVLNKQSVFFESCTSFKKGETVFLSINKL
jgi:ABC-type Fe3+/spermidine/putrescine transport system ATPase subunit